MGGWVSGIPGAAALVYFAATSDACVFACGVCLQSGAARTCVFVGGRGKEGRQGGRTGGEKTRHKGGRWIRVRGAGALPLRNQQTPSLNYTPFAEFQLLLPANGRVDEPNEKIPQQTHFYTDVAKIEALGGHIRIHQHPVAPTAHASYIHKHFSFWVLRVPASPEAIPGNDSCT